MNLTKLAFGALVAASMGASANAAVVGDTVNGSFTGVFDDNGTSVPFAIALNGETPAGPVSAVVGNGAKLIADQNPEFNLDLDETSVTITYDMNGAPSVGTSTTWAVSGFDDTVLGFSFTSGNVALIDDLGFDAYGFFFDFVNIAQADGDVNVFEFALNTDASATVPLPASIVLLLGGLGLLGFTSRRKA